MGGTEAEAVNLTVVDENGTTTTRKSSKGDEEPYNPHDHRKVESPTNNLETLLHLLKCSLGTGILAMPQAFTKAGLLVGTVGTVIIGMLITYCLHILISSQYTLCKKKRVPLLTYPESMREALLIGPQWLRGCSRFAPPVVDIFLVVYQLGIGCVYIVFLADTVKQFVDQWKVIPVQIHMTIILVPIIVLNMIRNLKKLAPYSGVANLVTLFGLAIVVYFLVTLERPVKEDPVDLWGSVMTFPHFFGTTLFALTAVGVVVTLENNMENPKSFGGPCGVLNIGMTIIVALYVIIGMLGYNFCRKHCADSITSNFPQEMWLTQLMMLLFVLAIFISYVLQCYVPFDILWKSYIKPRLEASGSQKLLLWEYVLRLVLCVCTFVVAISVPKLGLIISLFGAFCLSALGISFPALLHICSIWPPQNASDKMIVFKDVIIFIIGGIGLVAGTGTVLFG